MRKKHDNLIQYGLGIFTNCKYMFFLTLLSDKIVTLKSLYLHYKLHEK